MNIAQFDFSLPQELIAQAPAEPRDGARLLVVGPAPADRLIRDLPDLLCPGDLLVCNDTRVLPTRFWGRRGEVAVEATLVEAIDGHRWWALCRPGRRLRAGDALTLGDTLAATVEAKDGEGRVRLAFGRIGADLLAAIEAEGAMPLPPYIRRAAGGDEADHRHYQPLFARKPGSVAAPTASLHVTADLLARLDSKGIGRAFLTLHVGQGTFAPVKVDDAEHHRMHAEWLTIPSATTDAIARTRASGGRIVALGTTVLRALETAARDDGTITAGAATTSIFITPGWRFRAADLLLTNFHLPRSTLLMLACAFGGSARVMAAYAHAIHHGYRFFSYGDACLIERA